jgi:hypothetical protein
MNDERPDVFRVISIEKPTLNRSLDKWITQPINQADRLDPLAAFSCCTKRDRRNDPSPYHNDPDSKTDFDLSWQLLLIY